MHQHHRARGTCKPLGGMGLHKQSINVDDFIRMMAAAAERLRSNVDSINALNVFPVPDGDTGTNMNLTMASGLQELKLRSGTHLGKAAEALSKGLMMGARGNSGVILSQLFRGFAKSVAELERANAAQLATALQSGVDMAYNAVVKPVEGTILTVSREAAQSAAHAVSRTDDIVELFQTLVSSAKRALDRTPDQLPLLKQVGVVDAGGLGLVLIYEGFLHALRSPDKIADDAADLSVKPVKSAKQNEYQFHGRSLGVQARLSAEDIKFGYCTEFIIQLTPQGRDRFREESVRGDLGQYGNSLVVAADEDLVKVHIHAEYPGHVMNYAMQYGQLDRIKIENMREQHSRIVEESTVKKAGVVAVAEGEGLRDIFRSVGVDYMLSGGQTMNPSTEEIVEAIGRVAAETVFILPNNANIELAARQARELADKPVVIIPTTTIPQGLSAAIAFRPDADREANEAAMRTACLLVKSGSITYAIRDSTIGGMKIKAGDFLAMLDGDLVESGSDLEKTACALLDRMLAGGDEVVTIFSGKDVTDADAKKLKAYLAQRYPKAEAEFHDGGQPIYSYLISVE